MPLPIIQYVLFLRWPVLLPWAPIYPRLCFSPISLSAVYGLFSAPLLPCILNLQGPLLFLCCSYPVLSFGDREFLKIPFAYLPWAGLLILPSGFLYREISALKIYSL